VEFNDATAAGKVKIYRRRCTIKEFYVNGGYLQWSSTTFVSIGFEARVFSVFSGCLQRVFGNLSGLNRFSRQS
jgi:hypothetical protein